jgi:hypothetical protein
MDGFITQYDASLAFGSVSGEAAPGAPGVHVVDLMIRFVKRPNVWRGTKLLAELNSLIFMVALHFEASIHLLHIIPLRQLDDIAGSGGRSRHVSDMQRKEELMQLSARMGAALTASRLNTAFRAFQQEDLSEGKPSLPGLLVVGGAAADGSTVQHHFAGNIGACAFFSDLELVPVVAPILRGPQRDWTDYETMVMLQYAASTLLGFPSGPLHFAFDGCQLKTSGEINQYFVLAPSRPGVREMTAWLPVQVAE